MPNVSVGLSFNVRVPRESCLSTKHLREVRVPMTDRLSRIGGAPSGSAAGMQRACRIGSRLGKDRRTKDVKECHGIED